MRVLSERMRLVDGKEKSDRTGQMYFLFRERDRLNVESKPEMAC